MLDCARLGWLASRPSFPGWRWPSRAVHRQVPQRRHPPPAEDDGARVARRVRRARRAASRPTRRSALQPAGAALALPACGHADRARSRTSRSSAGSCCAASAAAARRRSASLPAGRGARRRSARRTRRGASASRPPRSARRCSSGRPIALAFIDLDTACCPTTSRCRCSGPGLLLNLGGAFVPLPRRGDRRGRRLPSLWLVYWGFKLAHRQGRHGLRRLQAARRARRLARLEDAAAGDPALVRGRRSRSARCRCSPRAAAGTAASASTSGPTSPLAGLVALFWGEPIAALVHAASVLLTASWSASPAASAAARAPRPTSSPGSAPRWSTPTPSRTS